MFTAFEWVVVIGVVMSTIALLLVSILTLVYIPTIRRIENKFDHTLDRIDASTSLVNEILLAFTSWVGLGAGETP